MVDERSFEEILRDGATEPDAEDPQGGAVPPTLDLTEALGDLQPPARTESSPPEGGASKAYEPPERTGQNLDETA